LIAGVAGFSGLTRSLVSFEDPNLYDDPILPGKNSYGDPNIEHKYTDNPAGGSPKFCGKMRHIVDQYPG